MILYKYLPRARVDVLQRRLIRFTQPAEFNDPFEFRPAFGDIMPEHLIDSMLTEELAKRKELIETIERLNPAAAATFRKEQTHIREFMLGLAPSIRTSLQGSFHTAMNNGAGVLCLSEVRDSLLMWGHYTDCYSGFVVGFDSEHPFFSNRRGPNDEFGFLRQVKYDMSRPSVTFDDVDSAKLFQTKSQEWAYEKEWRIIRALDSATTRIPATPFPICLFQFDADAVREIIVGMRANPDLIATLRRLKAQFPHATLLAAREHKTDFRLVIDEL